MGFGERSAFHQFVAYLLLTKDLKPANEDTEGHNLQVSNIVRPSRAANNEEVYYLLYSFTPCQLLKYVCKEIAIE